jgi:ribonuclease HII
MICGIDEAGRGPLAGPVCAAAVILPADFPSGILGDSKKLSPAAREKARLVICREAAAWGIGWASAAEIDGINILRASLLAMKRAFAELLRIAGLSAPGRPPPEIDEIIVDGLYTPDLAPLVTETCPLRFGRAAQGEFFDPSPLPLKALVKADNLIPAVMAASILAKTARDRMMERYGWIYPEYGYEKHKGYPTGEHRKRIAEYGPSPIQRMSFRV